MYSCIDNDFMIIENGVRSDLKGNKYTQEEFEQKLPLFNMRQLLISGTMPDSINGYEMDPHFVNSHRSYYRFKPAAQNAPKPGIYPLIESESGRAQLEMPKDFFRIKGRMEFVDAASNEVNEEKTRMFTAVLQKRGFRFPAKIIEGLPTTRKSCDEGYMVVDANDELFHVKMVQAKPYVVKVDKPDSLKFKYINCVDFSDKKYYSYLFSEKNELYILTQDEYELIKWPVEGIRPETEEVRIYGDFFHYNVIVLGETHVKDVVLDKDYQKVDEYKDSWPPKSETKEGRIFSFIFPAEINLSDSYSSFTDFFFTRTVGFGWIILNILLLIAHFIIIRSRKVILKNHLIDLALILATGIYGFIAVNIFPNKLSD